jgi:hypothetical protein
MPTTPPFIPVKPRKRRKRKSQVALPAPPDPNAPVLVSAEFVLGFAIDFSFDRALNVTGIVPAAFILDDQIGGNRWRGTDASNIFFGNFRMSMEIIGPAQGAGVRLTVSAGNGVLSQADGTPWPGVTNLELPYP